MYTYGVMPFGPVNGPVIFIWMMFNINGESQAMSIGNVVVISEDTNPKIIMDDCLNWDIVEDQAFFYMETQFIVEPGACCVSAFPSPCSFLHV